jgi:hypothetical protein
MGPLEVRLLKPARESAGRGQRLRRKGVLEADPNQACPPARVSALGRQRRLLDGNQKAGGDLGTARVRRMQARFPPTGKPLPQAPNGAVGEPERGSDRA